MYIIKDENGNVVPGLYKNNRGAIVVKNDQEYAQYMKDIQQQETINNVIKEMTEIKSMLHQLLSVKINTDIPKDN